MNQGLGHPGAPWRFLAGGADFRCSQGMGRGLEARVVSSRAVGLQLQPSCPHFPSWYCVDRVVYGSEVRRFISNRQYLAALHQTAITFLWEGNLMAVVTLPALPPPPPPRWSQSVLVPFGCSLLPYLPVMPAVLEAPTAPPGPRRGIDHNHEGSRPLPGLAGASNKQTFGRGLSRQALCRDRLYACLPPRPPPRFRLSSPGPLLAVVQYCFCVSLIY